MSTRILTAKELMSSRLLTVRPTMGLPELVEFLRENGIHGALVQDGQRLVGVVSLTDILLHLSDGAEEGQPFWRLYQTDNPEYLERIPEGMDDVTVDDLMTPKVVTCSVDDSAGKVAGMMKAEGIHRAVVLEDGKAVGLISATDLLEAIVHYEQAAEPAGSGAQASC